jgi:hypothetical protein
LTAVTPEHRTNRTSLPALPLDRVQAAAVWLMMVSSFFVIVEPAPCDLLFAVAVVLFLAHGLTVNVLVAPMILYLLLYNLGGFISFLEVSNENKAGMFVITSIYMSASAVFFAFYVSDDTGRRMAIFKNGYIVGAVIASIIGLIGYFNIAGLGATLSPIQRAQGTFKDPNVLSTYLILPALLLTQDVMLGTRGWRMLRYGALLIVVACLFLAFSRGAWINFAAAVTMMVLLTFTLTPSAQLRSRIILLAIAGVAVGAILLMALLSVESTRSLFLDRLTLTKDYDSGEFGRFGNQANSIQYLVERPFGFGPTLFRRLFGLDPHNVYLNAFSSYGWLGGVTYFLMVVSTIIVGFRAVLIRTPWQSSSIALFCAMFTTMLQGVQIDTDHWRHFYWMLGLVWGLYAASAIYAARAQAQAHTVAAQ